MPTDDEAAIRDRLAKLAAEGRHVEREAVAWQLADYIMRELVGFNPHRRPFYAVGVDKMATPRSKTRHARGAGADGALSDSTDRNSSPSTTSSSKLIEGA